MTIPPHAIARLADPRVRVLHHHKPLGVSAARNSGAGEARGEWLAFVDDDDLWAPDKLVRQLAAAQALGREWAYTGSVNITDRGRILVGSSAARLLRKSWRRSCDTTRFRPEAPTLWSGGRRGSRPGSSTPACAIPRTGRCGSGSPSTDLPHVSSRPLIAYRVHTSNSSLEVAEIVRGAKLIESLHRHKSRLGLIASLDGRVVPAQGAAAEPP